LKKKRIYKYKKFGLVSSYLIKPKMLNKPYIVKRALIKMLDWREVGTQYSNNFSYFLLVNNNRVITIIYLYNILNYLQFKSIYWFIYFFQKFMQMKLIFINKFNIR